MRPSPTEEKKLKPAVQPLLDATPALRERPLSVPTVTRRAIVTPARNESSFNPATEASRPVRSANPMERIPTRWLLTASVLLCLLLWAAPGWSQTSGDATSGKVLFEDTPNVDGVPNSVTNNCTNCHTSVQDRRIKIGGSAFADITFDTAINHLGQAINSRPEMSQFKALSGQQVADLAAYIADTPKVSATGLSSDNVLAFSAATVGTSVTHSLSITHSTATAENLQVTQVDLGTGTTQFTRNSSCVSASLSPAGSCTFSVTFTPTSSTAESRALTLTLKQGSSTFTRAVTLNGSVAGATQPPPASGSSGNSDSGGGALSWIWLVGLGLASVTVARRR